MPENSLSNDAGGEGDPSRPGSKPRRLAVRSKFIMIRRLETGSDYKPNGLKGAA